MVTRTGGNRFSGTLFYFDRRPEYNANEWENNIDDLDKRIFTQYMPGFSVGGPIRRNRTFFFVNTQWLRAEQTPEVTRTVYTAAARQGIWRYRRSAAISPPAWPAHRWMPTATVVPIATYDIAGQ